MFQKFYKTVIILTLGAHTMFGQQAVPVDLISGRPQISIPLFSVGEGALHAGVSLYYSTSGAQPDFLGGSAGVGWQLQAGGSVHRVLRGLPDDMGNASSRSGWLYAAVADSVGAWTPSTENPSATHEDADWTKLEYFKHRDTEPDEFMFNAPGLGGKFIFGNDGQPKLVPYQDVDIDITYSGDQIQSIVITNNQGIKYTFSITTSATREARLPTGVTEPEFYKTNAELYATPITYTTSWKLSKIEGVTGEVIDFLYENTYYGVREQDVVVIDQSGVSDSIYYIKESYSSADQLYRIQTSLQTIDIGWADGLLNNVILSQSGTSINREFQFAYNFHMNDVDPTAAVPADKVPFLDSVTELLECSPQPSYDFSYKDVYVAETKSYTTTTLPIHNDAIGRDLWGNYNSVAISKVPKVYMDSNASMADRFRLQPASSQDTLAGTNRDLNINTVYDGALTSISFPTGGQAVITYEPNSYYDAEANRNILGNGIRVKETKFSGASSFKTSYEYKAENDSSSGKVIYPVVMAFPAFDEVVRLPDNAAPESGVIYERVNVIKEGQGRTVYTYNTGPAYPDVTSGNWSATRVRYARENIGSEIDKGSSNAELKNDYYQFPFPPNTNIEIERGQLKTVQLFNEAGNLISEQNYTYQLSTYNADTVEAIKYEVIHSTSDDDVYMYGKYKVVSGLFSSMTLEEALTVSEMDSLDTLKTTATRTYNTSNMLKSTASTNSDGTVYTTKYSYAGDYPFSAEPTNTDSKGIYNLNEQNRHGTLIEVRQYADDGTDEVISASLTLFDKFNNAYYLPSKTMVSRGRTGFQLAGISSNELIYDSSYELAAQMDQYQGHGLVETSSDDKHNKVGLHYGYDKTIPLLQIAGAGGNEVLYEGFETVSSYDLNINDSSSEAWIGKAYDLITTKTLTSDTISKSMDDYLISCWVKGSATADIDISISDGTATVTSTLSYGSGDVGTWTYLEKRVNISTVSSSAFTIQVSTSSDVTLDEFIFYPEDAVITITSYEPMLGTIAQTNSKGQSVFYTYDEKRRLKYIKNQDKDIIQYNEYKTYYDETPKVNAAFNRTSSNEIVMGDPVGFIAEGNCISNVSYSWTASYFSFVGDSTVEVATGTGSTFGFTPTKNTDYKVILEATHTSFGTTFSQITVNPKPTFDFIAKVNTSPLYSCDPNTNSKTVEVLFIMGDGCFDANDITYAWYYEKDSGGWQLITEDGEQSFDFTPNATEYGTYSFKCTISSKCYDYRDGHYSVHFDPVVETRTSDSFDFENDEPCQ